MPTHLSLLHTLRGLQGLQEVVVLFELVDTDLQGREFSLCTARGHTGLADSPLTGQQKVLVEMYRNVQKCTEIYRNVQKFIETCGSAAHRERWRHPVLPRDPTLPFLIL